MKQGGRNTLPMPRRSGYNPPMDEQQVEAVRQYVQQHIAQPVRVDDLADIAGISPSCFTRLFKVATGHTPHQFVMRERIARAQDLIRDPKGLSLSQIALRAGFNDQAHLTRIFRQVTGETPAQFCRNGRAGDASQPGHDAA